MELSTKNSGRFNPSEPSQNYGCFHKKQAALQIGLQLLIPKNLGLTISKLWDVSILSFPFNFFFFWGAGMDVSKFQVSTTSQESSYLAPSSYLPRSARFPHEHLHPARATLNASTYSVHTISGPHAKRWSLSNLQVASHELLSGRPGTRDGPFFLLTNIIKPSMATLKSLSSNKITMSKETWTQNLWHFFCSNLPLLLLSIHH